MSELFTCSTALKFENAVTKPPRQLSPSFIQDSECSNYCIEGNIGGGKLWRIWRVTINLSKFDSPIFILMRVLTCEQSAVFSIKNVDT